MNLDEDLIRRAEAAGNRSLSVVVPGIEGTAKPAKRSKYRNVRTSYNGVLYDSKAEANYAYWLDVSAQQGGVIAEWVRQPIYELGCPENRYRGDFKVTYRDGAIEVIDVKGHPTAKFKRDKKLWAAYGPCPLRIVTAGKPDEIIEPRGGSR